MDTTSARTNMVDGQLRPNRIRTPALLEAFGTIPRETYIPAQHTALAYADTAVPLGSKRELMSPLNLAHLLEALAPQRGGTLVVLAGNSGYSTAVAAGLGTSVTMVEDDPALLAQARHNLAPLLASGTVNIIEADPASWQGKQADNVLLDTTVTTLPPHAHKWVAEGGKIATIQTSAATGIPTLTVYTRHGHTLFAEELQETCGMPHPAFTEAQHFVF